MRHYSTDTRHILQAPNPYFGWFLYYTIYEKYHFVSEISQQTHKMYEKYGHNYSNLPWSQILFIYLTCISNIGYLITVLNMNKINPFFYEISKANKILVYEKVAIITQIWHRTIEVGSY